MLTGSCHCGTVKIQVPRKPRSLTSCNCSICRRHGGIFGYYDKLLHKARPDTPLVALAFECQLLDEIPTAAHDVFMDLVLSEKATYRGRGRGATS